MTSTRQNERASSAAVSTAQRVPLGTFAIAFGLSGLADDWDLASSLLGLPHALVNCLWALAGISWLALLVTHAVAGHRSQRSLVAQLRDPIQAPLAALAPVTGMLLSAGLANHSLLAGRLLFGISASATTLYAGWILATWFAGGLDINSVHGGYMLPTVAGGLVGAEVAADLGYTSLGWWMFGAGLFFWIILCTLIVFRLMVSPALPDPLAPSMAILIAPPAVAGLAWHALTGALAGPVPQALAGVTALMLLVQLALVPRYLRLRFTMGFWSFTFPFAAAVAYALTALTPVGSAAQHVAGVTLISLATLLIGGISVVSIAMFARSVRERYRPTAQKS